MTENDFNEYCARRALIEERQSQREFAIEELEKIKADIKDVLDLNNERDMLLPASYICKLVDKHINELKGENK